MATFSDIRATFGLVGVGIPVKSGTTGSVQIGTGATTTRLVDSTGMLSFDAVIVGSASDLVIELDNQTQGAATTSWTAGNAQAESVTIVAASGASNGTLGMTLTSGVVAGSPLTVNAALTSAAHTTAALIAQACVDALNANAAVAAKYTASRSTAAIVLTRKATTTYVVNGTSLPVYPASDATLELVIPTALGITGDTSAELVPATATAGVYAPDLNGNDFEGEGIDTGADVYGLSIKNNSGSEGGALITQASILTDYPLPIGADIQVGSSIGGINMADITIEPASDSCHISFTYSFDV